MNFSLVHFASNGINPGAPKLILIFNFHYWMKLNRMKERNRRHVNVL